MCQYCIHKIEDHRAADVYPAAPRAPFGVIEIEAYGKSWIYSSRLPLPPASPSLCLHSPPRLRWNTRKCICVRLRRHRQT